MPLAIIRKYAALLIASTLAMDYYRDIYTFTTFANWILALHFLYFQLPLKSSALAYFHSVSFIGAFSIPPLYVYLLLKHPSLEAEHMEMWSVEWSSVLIRSFSVHIAPLLFHLADLYVNLPKLRQSYQTRPNKIILAWPVVAFLCFTLLFDLVFPETEDTEDMERSTIEEFSRVNKLITVLTIAVSYSLLYGLVIRKRSDQTRPISQSASKRSSETSNGDGKLEKPAKQSKAHQS